MKKVLYLLGTSPQTRTDRLAILEAAGPGDALLLHQDAVFALLPLTPFVEGVESRGVRVVACAPDCRARGVAAPPDAVDWAGFVQLLAEYDVVVS